MFLDNSACNLASLNLRKFQGKDGSFDVERYRAAARTFVTAQEILVDNAGYPSDPIARNSHEYRPTWPWLCEPGCPADGHGASVRLSEQGRAVAGALMAIDAWRGIRPQCRDSWPTLGLAPSPGFAENRASMLG